MHVKPVYIICTCCNQIHRFSEHKLFSTTSYLFPIIFKAFGRFSSKCLSLSILIYFLNETEDGVQATV